MNINLSLAISIVVISLKSKGESSILWGNKKKFRFLSKFSIGLDLRQKLYDNAGISKIEIGNRVSFFSLP